MTTETTSRVDRLLSLFETSLISLANEFAERAKEELLAADKASKRHEFGAANEHRVRANVFCDACRASHRQIIAINNEVLK